MPVLIRTRYYLTPEDSNELIFRRDAEENEENILDEDDGVVDQVARDLIDTELSQVWQCSKKCFKKGCRLRDQSTWTCLKNSTSKTAMAWTLTPLIEPRLRYNTVFVLFRDLNTRCRNVKTWQTSSKTWKKRQLNVVRSTKKSKSEQK